MSRGLPDLLEALAETFLHPGAFPVEVLHLLRGEAWVSPPLAAALDRLLATPAEDLAVEFAGLFLVGRHRPTLHLELSALRHGRYQAPEVMVPLEALFSQAGLKPPEGVSGDHLGLLLALLAHSLRELALGEHADAMIRCQQLLEGFLLPLTRALQPDLPQGFYGATLDVTLEALLMTREMLS